jgi:hypothetical protein
LISLRKCSSGRKISEMTLKKSKKKLSRRMSMSSRRKEGIRQILMVRL